MNYKKIILATLVGISTLSFITFFNNNAHKENINLKLTDISGNRKELDKELSATISTSYGKGRDIKVNKDTVILTNDFDFDSELMQKKEDIIKNKKFYKNAKGYAISNTIQNDNGKIYAKLIKDKGTINIYQLKNNNFKEFKIPLNEKDLQMIKTNEQSYLTLIGENGSKFYAALTIQNLYGKVLKRSLIEIDSSENSYKSLDLDIQNNSFYRYFMHNNKMYAYDVCALYNIDFENSKFNELITYSTGMSEDEKLRVDKNYFYVFHVGISPGENRISAFNLTTGDIIDCGEIDSKQFNNLSVRLEGDKLYKIYEKVKTDQDFANNIEKTTRIIEIYNIKTKKTLYKGALEINKDLGLNLEVA